MNETIMKALMRLFAIAASVNEEGVSPRAKEIVTSYLKGHLPNDLVQMYLDLFEQYLARHKKRYKKAGIKQAKGDTLNAVKVLMICQQINETLEQREKQIVFVRLIEFINEDEFITTKEQDFIHTVAETFNISNYEFEHLMGLVLNEFDRITDKSKLLVVNSTNFSGHDDTEEMGPWFAKNRPDGTQEFKHIQKPKLDGEIVMLHIVSTNTFFMRYDGRASVYLNGQVVMPRKAYTLENGCIVKSRKISPIYYSDVASKFLYATDKTRLDFYVHDVQFHFKNSTNGIQKFNLHISSGQLIGIMGGSGTGKSTLFNLLNGTIAPQEGEILINGYNLQTDAAHLHGLIGYVPQDDLLIEELTVFENLYYNTKLCFNQFSEKRILETVQKMLADLDLEEIKDLTVGNPINKFISGGQRKRLNIALELIREPSVLFVDEPTSGLSSMDSEMVMLLLKEQTIKGRLVVVNIHQPSSYIYKLFDKLLILDKGGRMVYNGNPIDAISYFKRLSHHVNPNESDCVACGNVNTELVLQIIEAKVVNEFGQYTKRRKMSPSEWYSFYKTDLEKHIKPIRSKTELPKILFKVPGLLKQFYIFFMRNLKSKLTNTQYMLINLLQAPVLGFILSYATKYIVGSDDDPMLYLFAENKNLPGFLFMGIIVSLFMGLTVSAEEIIKDRRILQRESFLNLSRFSYVSSKVSLLVLLSAIQTLSFVLISHFVLEIQGMVWAYWLLLFTASVWANLVGLNISSGLNSVVAIYILIPFILVPQLLLSGAMIPFENLHKQLSSKVVVPVIGDMMVSRWIYEATTVHFFKYNNFQRHFFDADFTYNDASFKTVYLIPKIKSLIDECETGITLNKPQENKHRLRIISNEIKQLDQESPQISPFGSLADLSTERFSMQTAATLKAHLALHKKHLSETKNQAAKEKESIYQALIDKYTKEGVYKLQSDNHNKALSSILLKKMELTKILEDEERLVQNAYPIYRKPESNMGRAHFYSPYKQIGNSKIETFWYNIFIVWLMSFVLFFTLWHNSLRKAIEYFNRIYFRWQLKKFGKL